MFARTRTAAVADTLPWAAFLATTLAMLGSVLLHARWLPASLLVAFVLLLGLRVALRWRGVGRIALWLRLLVVLGLVALVASTLGNLFGREAGSALLAAMLVSKLLETDTRRDARIVLTVVAFLAMAGFLFDQGMLQAAMTAGVCLLMLAAMYELDPASAQQAQRAPHRAFSSAGMREAARHLALAIPFALVCFFLFPRLSAPMWGAPQDAFTGRTGISDTMEPGALAGLALDDSVAMRVRFDGEAPPPAQRYWRGLVLWNFDGRVWGGADLLGGFRAEPQLEPLGPTIGYEITLEPTDKRWLFLLDAPLGAPDDATLTGDFQARAARPVTSALRYRGQSSTSYRMQAELPRGVRTLGLRLPASGNPRARALARDWRNQVGDNPRAIADLALRNFNQTFSYSFEVPLLGGDPIDDFLFEVRSGWCEHYASAFVFLMRAAGVPACRRAWWSVSRAATSTSAATTTRCGVPTHMRGPRSGSPVRAGCGSTPPRRSHPSAYRAMRGRPSRRAAPGTNAAGWPACATASTWSATGGPRPWCSSARSASAACSRMSASTSTMAGNWHLPCSERPCWRSRSPRWSAAGAGVRVAIRCATRGATGARAWPRPASCAHPPRARRISAHGPRRPCPPMPMRSPRSRTATLRCATLYWRQSPLPSRTGASVRVLSGCADEHAQRHCIASVRE